MVSLEHDGRFRFSSGQIVSVVLTHPPPPRALLLYIYANLPLLWHSFRCSTEGRGSMDIDVVAFEGGLRELCKDSVMNLLRGQAYICAFNHAAYFSEEELITWINQNFRAYSYRHLHGLLKQNFMSLLNPKRLKVRSCT